jgi:hypothetical protein
MEQVRAFPAKLALVQVDDTGKTILRLGRSALPMRVRIGRVDVEVLSVDLRKCSNGESEDCRVWRTGHGHVVKCRRERAVAGHGAFAAADIPRVDAHGDELQALPAVASSSPFVTPIPRIPMKQGEKRAN